MLEIWEIELEGTTGRGSLLTLHVLSQTNPEHILHSS